LLFYPARTANTRGSEHRAGELRSAFRREQLSQERNERSEFEVALGQAEADGLGVWNEDFAAGAGKERFDFATRGVFEGEDQITRGALAHDGDTRRGDLHDDATDVPLRRRDPQVPDV